MALAQNMLKHLRAVLNSTAIFSSFPLSCLLIGLEALIDMEFSCPCRVNMNRHLSNLIFIAPACFAFLLMFFLLRPFKYTCLPPIEVCKSCDVCIDQKFCFKPFLQCVVPPVVWVFLVFYDGDYYACWSTNWNGTYISDDELKMKWCKPSNSRGETQRDLTQTLVVWSQIYSYSLLIAFCALTLLFVSIYDCCGGKFGQKKKDKEEHKPLTDNDETANAHSSAESNV